MADAPAFDWICNELEQRSALDRLEARGTVRIALKEAGLDSRSLTADQVRVVLEKVLPKELESRGVADAGSLCTGLAASLKQAAAGWAEGSGAESPEDVFRRLAGGA